jgi:hypothetical protein
VLIAGPTTFFPIIWITGALNACPVALPNAAAFESEGVLIFADGVPEDVVEEGKEEGKEVSLNDSYFIRLYRA